MLYGSKLEFFFKDITVCDVVLNCEASAETPYGKDGPGIESWWGERFSLPVQTGPGARAASVQCATGLFPGSRGAEAWH